jgi:hypothetical protein
MVRVRTNNKYTTLRISKKLKTELRKLAKHERETDEQIIERLIQSE